MSYEKRRFIGLVLFLAGLLFVLNGFSGITGFAVYEGIGKGASYIIGLALMLAGLILMARKIIDFNRNDEREKGIVQRIREIDPVKTPFRDAIEMVVDLVHMGRPRYGLSGNIELDKYATQLSQKYKVPRNKVRRYLGSEIHNEHLDTSYRDKRENRS